MTWLALLLICLGVTDLVRGNSARVGLGRALAAVAISVAIAIALLWSANAGGWMTAGTAAGVAVAVSAWTVVTSFSLREDRPTWPALTTGSALFAVALAISPYSPGLSGRLERWYADVPLDVLDGVPLERFLLVLGCGLVLTSTGNVLVRLVLYAAGSKVTRSEQQIKGGRILGPMERLLIFGLGLGGELAAASIIVAAKGLLRFPELQSYRAEVGSRETTELSGQRIDVLTEYFLIGSLASWMLAIAALLLP
jgi:hypothetical protein